MHQFHRDFRDHAQGSFRADKYTAKIVTRGIGHFAAEPNNDAVVEHGFDTENVIGGDAVSERVRPAGIVRHVAADGTRRLTAGVRCIEKTVFGDSFRHVQVDHARFDDSDAIFEIDF